ncbi:hypothetical protein MNB_SUP05-SYMBIONT-7-426 [hydrothermal vent metagenome]|uniref:Uncharacterized protein n=1 Tax=hydrothermal vent metagenome TaxID=652676 RepID=A0A1W1E5Y5_9ZZZZ
MKKILLTMSAVFALSSVQADLLAIEHTHNWKDSPAISNVSKVVSVSYKAALKAAKSEQRKAKKAGFEWNTIRKLMKSAKKKNKAGDVRGAVKLLKVAKEHGILGQKQARDQVNAGPNF